MCWLIFKSKLLKIIEVVEHCPATWDNEAQQIKMKDKSGSMVPSKINLHTIKIVLG